MARNGKVIISKGINLDNTYSNVLNYSESDMLSLMTSQSHLMYQNDTYSFIREQDNQIDVEVPYSTCLQSNYIAFQNPNYSNKWFFAFIKDVKFTSEKNTTITYEIDVFTTWFRNITLKPSFIEREHVNDDTRGLHTVPENLELGDYITQAGSETYQQRQDLFFLMNDNDRLPVFAVTHTPDGTTPGTGTVTPQYNGSWSGLWYMVVKNDEVDFARALQQIDNTADCELYAIFMAPASLVNPTYHWDLSTGGYNFNYTYVTSDVTYTSIGSIGVNKENHLASNYTPKNNKLLTFPYCYFQITNFAGNVVNYKYEDFSQNYAKFDIIGAVSIGCDIKLIPSDFKPAGQGQVIGEKNYYKDRFSYAVDMYKLPTCSWVSDSYTNWLTQNSVNLTMNKIGTAGSFALGALAIGTGNVLIGAGAIGAGLAGIKEQIVSKKNAELTPDSATMGSNMGNLNFAMHNTFNINKLTIKEEYARIIDNYFTRFGYQINRVKEPNITGRKYWNFVKIGTGEDIGNGDVPNKFKDTLNQIFRNGTTIWHSHDNIGNFNLNNTIVS